MSKLQNISINNLNCKVSLNKQSKPWNWWEYLLQRISARDVNHKYMTIDYDSFTTNPITATVFDDRRDGSRVTDERAANHIQ
jgi:hypothetical protein